MSNEKPKTTKDKRSVKRLIIGIILVAFGAFLILNSVLVSSQPTATINRQEIKLELALTPESQERGLSGRQSLGKDEGLLFSFDLPDYRYFWMKDMNFSIDIIWIDENLEVVGITKNLSPSTYPEKFSSTKPAQYVLEVKAGYSDKHDIRVGDQVELDI